MHELNKRLSCVGALLSREWKGSLGNDGML